MANVGSIVGRLTYVKGRLCVQYSIGLLPKSTGSYCMAKPVDLQYLLGREKNESRLLYAAKTRRKNAATIHRSSKTYEYRLSLYGGNLKSATVLQRVVPPFSRGEKAKIKLVLCNGQKT